MAVSKSSVMAAAVVCMVVLSVHVEVTEALTCGQVTGSLGQCFTYIRGGGTPTTACCDGVRKLNGLARTTPDRKQACACLKALAGGLKGINYEAAAALPGKCGVSVPYKISPSTDCSRLLHTNCISYSFLFLSIHVFSTPTQRFLHALPF